MTVNEVQKIADELVAATNEVAKYASVLQAIDDYEPVHHGIRASAQFDFPNQRKNSFMVYLSLDEQRPLIVSRLQAAIEVRKEWEKKFQTITV